jgi:hypothetical protein
MLKINNSSNGPQLKLNKTQQNYQNATEIMDQQVLTAKLLDALVLMDHLMDQPVLHALETNQLPSHTITLTQPPADHTPPQEILLIRTQHHQFQPKQSSNYLTMPNQQLRPHQHQKKSLFLTQRSPRPTPLSMDKSEVKMNKSKYHKIN